MIIAERGQLVFVFNFHPTNSYTDYRIGCRTAGPYKVCTSCKFYARLLSSPVLANAFFVSLDQIFAVFLQVAQIR